ncbi:MAG: choice-of-anchor L domain-containing protein [Flavobacteriales bacterium]|nr:choice-of-anchor L domain-containing protein [Flavobacteriales bacterium]
MNRIYLIFSVLSFGFTSLQAQIVVDSLAIEEYVQDVLLGSGVSATNITYTGCLDQFGYMHEGSSVGLGIDGGVVLSTEVAENIEIPSPFLGLWGTCTPVSGEPDLLTIANSVPPLIGMSFSVGSANDVAILEFDFVPTGDTLSFKYIFGSNEYLEWVNTGYNDIFAFFLSGPGISGPYDAPAGFPDGAKNIAILPDSDPELPITISSVNSTLNSEFYIDNPMHEGITIDGYTVTLTAWSEVICGETYHIKLAIADGSDGALESIVILEEGSFSSNAVVDVNLSLDVGGPEATTIYEDCGLATLTFTRAPISDLAVEDMVVMTYSGDAINGVDYTLLPDTILFPIGVQTVVFELDAFEDGLTEGLELVHFDILNLAACNGSGMTTEFEFWIDDLPLPLVVEGYETEICLSDTLEITPIISGGYGNFQFDWSTGETTESIFVYPDVTTSYNVVVSDTCGMPSDDADILVNILVYPPLEVEIDSDDLLLNCGESVSLTATATGGNGIYSGWYWYDEADLNLWGWENTLWYSSWNGEGEINVSVTDGCGFTATDVINVELNVPDLIVDVPTEVSAPCGLPTDITANVSGGSSPYYYTWYIDGMWQWDWDQTLTATYSGESVVELYVSDNCGQSQTIEIQITIDAPPIELTLVDELTGTCLTEFDIVPEVSAGSGGFSYQWTEGGSTIGSGATLNNFQSDVNTTVNLMVTDACGESAGDVVNIIINNPPVDIEIGDDINSSCITVNPIDVEILSGAGGYSYTWYVDGVEVGSGPTQDVQTYETADVSVLVEDACGSSDTDLLTIIIPDIPIELVTSLDTAVCVNGSAQLWALASGGEGGFMYEWTPVDEAGDVLNLTGLTGSGIYTVTATDICGDQQTANVMVEVMPIEADFEAEEIGASLFEFVATPVPECDPEDCNYAFFWDFGDGFLAEGPVVEHQFDGFSQYTTMLTVVNEIGCTSNAYYTVTAPIIIYIPNSFTPNADGVNDAWFIQGANIEEFEVMIFNRWGDVIFESTDISVPWTGDVHNGDYFAPDGIYTYFVKVKGYEGDAFKRSGTVNVMR